MADTDWLARGIAVGSFALAAATFTLNRLDRRPRVRVYAHRATDHTGGSIFQSAHATALGPDEPAIWPPPRVNLYLIVVCDRETELSKAWFQFGPQSVDVQSAQPLPPVRLLPHQQWHGWVPWNSVPDGVAAAEAPTLGRAILTVTGAKVHESRSTPRNLLLGGNVPGPDR